MDLSKRPKRTKYGRYVQEITLEEIKSHFDIPSEAAAGKLGVGVTMLKRLCRAHGIHRWPYLRPAVADKRAALAAQIANAVAAKEIEAYPKDSNETSITTIHNLSSSSLAALGSNLPEVQGLPGIAELEAAFHGSFEVWPPAGADDINQLENALLAGSLNPSKSRFSAQPLPAHTEEAEDELMLPVVTLPDDHLELSDSNQMPFGGISDADTPTCGAPKQNPSSPAQPYHKASAMLHIPGIAELPVLVDAPTAAAIAIFPELADEQPMQNVAQNQPMEQLPAEPETLAMQQPAVSQHTLPSGFQLSEQEVDEEEEASPPHIHPNSFARNGHHDELYASNIFNSSLQTYPALLHLDSDSEEL